MLPFLFWALHLALHQDALLQIDAADGIASTHADKLIILRMRSTSSCKQTVSDGPREQNSIERMRVLREARHPRAGRASWRQPLAESCCSASPSRAPQVAQKSQKHSPPRPLPPRQTARWCKRCDLQMVAIPAMSWTSGGVRDILIRLECRFCQMPSNRQPSHRASRLETVFHSSSLSQSACT